MNTGAGINTLNIVGGRIQNTIQNTNTTTRNVFFDRRYKSKANFAPPWFPSTTVTTTTTSDSATVTPSVQRVKWEDTSDVKLGSTSPHHTPHNRLATGGQVDGDQRLPVP